MLQLGQYCFTEIRKNSRGTTQMTGRMFQFFLFSFPFCLGYRAIMLEWPETNYDSSCEIGKRESISQEAASMLSMKRWQ